MNGVILTPSVVWMELKCKRPKESDITKRRDEIVLFRPRCPYRTLYLPDMLRFQPLTQPDPPWTIPRGFHVGSFVLEAFTQPEGGDSLWMWDIGGQENYREGETISAGECSVLR